LGDCHDTDPDGEAERRQSDGDLAEVLERVVSGRTKRNELHTLLPWDWPSSTSATITGQTA
jgi:hypothetical protein